MSILLDDAVRWPEPFSWFGAIPAIEIEDWLRRNQITIPSDLIELWKATSGGDVFESETILRPTVQTLPNSGFVGDDIESANRSLSTARNSDGLFIFQRGVFRSAIRLRDQQFVTLDDNFMVTGCYPSLDEWYVYTIRTEFGSRYGLNSIGI
jgi:hypothetical protein